MTRNLGGRVQRAGELTRTWRPKRARLNIFAQHEMLIAAFPGLQPNAEDIHLQRARMHACSRSARGSVAGRSATRGQTSFCLRCERDIAHRDRTAWLGM